MTFYYAFSWHLFLPFTTEHREKSVGFIYLLPEVVQRNPKGETFMLFVNEFMQISATPHSFAYLYRARSLKLHFAAAYYSTICTAGWLCMIIAEIGNLLVYLRTCYEMKVIYEFIYRYTGCLPFSTFCCHLLKASHFLIINR